MHNLIDMIITITELHAQRIRELLE